MPLNKTKLSSDFNKIFKKAATSAFKKTYQTNADFVETELSKHDKMTDAIMGDVMSRLRDKMSNDFGKEFAKVSAADAASAVEQFVKSATVQHVLTSPQGPVTGKIILL